jgi:putative ABC transport system permease protein
MGWTRYFRRSRWDAERARELEAYLEEETHDNIARGMSPEDARRAARGKLGNPTLIREDIYNMNTLAILESIWRDLRYGLRILRKNPTFTIVAVLTLALGTGANTAIFQIVDAVKWRTLPVANPHELVELRVETNGTGRTGTFRSRRPMMTNVLWDRLRDTREPFSSTFAWAPMQFDLSATGEQRPIDGLWVSGSFFQTLGVTAARGRVILPADDVRGCSAPGVVLSDGFWRREYGADPQIVGRSILLDGHRFDVVGITAAQFFGVEVGRTFDVALPLCSEPIFRGSETLLERGDGWFLSIMGRLKPGWTVERTTDHLRSISAGIFRETLPTQYVPQDAKSYQAFTLYVNPAGTGVSGLRNQYSTPLNILLVLTGAVLLITCANLANLMLARATAREREINVRLAIGASRIRLIRQMLSESLLLAVVGAVGGLVLSSWLSQYLVTYLSTDGARLFLDLSFNWRIFAFTTSIAVAACLLFGLTPALRATRSARAASMLITRGATDSRERFTLRRTLVVTQVALSLVLVIGALLFGRSLRNLTTLDPGFREENTLVVNLDMRRAGVARQNMRPLYNSIVERLRGVPGVASAAESFIAPMSGSGWNERVVLDGKLLDGAVNFNAIGPGFFQTMGTRLVAGRDFTERDTPGTPRVALVNERFVTKYLGGQSPIGRVVTTEQAPGRPAPPRYEIVGIAADTKYTDLREELTPIIYAAALQETDLFPGLTVIVHSSIGHAGITPGIVQALREINPAITIQFQTMERMMRDTLTTDRLMATLSGFFGGLAVLIATIGLYGVMSYMVARRRMEIGIRMALGADRGSVIRMVLGDAGRLLAIGIVIGTALAVLGARSAAALLYQLQPWDPLTLTMSAAVLGSVALAASFLPALRAARATPTIALREE